jgi:hypothetical protein
MKVDGRHFRAIWLDSDGWSVGAIDQRMLPHEFIVARLTTCAEAAEAIRNMLVRGAPLIGATAAYGMALAMRDDKSDAGIASAHDMLIATRPTAVNLKWALEEMRAVLQPLAPGGRHCRGRHRHQSGHRQKRSSPDRGNRRAQETGRGGQCPDPLQCRLACYRRLGHGDRADLSRTRSRHRPPYLGR